jgi:hypothetical protein
MQAGLPTARGVIQRAARASVWGSSLGLQDPAVFVTYSPLSESVIPFVLNCCSAIRWLDRSAVQRHRSSTVRWLGCSLCVLPAACCPLDLASCPLLQARRTVESTRRILPNAFLPVVCPLPAACCHLDPLPCPCPLPTTCWPLPWRARHPTPQHRTHEILNHRRRFHGIPICCIDRQEL